MKNIRKNERAKYLFPINGKKVFPSNKIHIEQYPDHIKNS